METAGTDSALAQQVALFARTVQTQAQTIQVLQDQVAELQNKFQSMHSEYTSYRARDAAAATVTPAQEARLPLPEKFGGDRKKFRGFLNQCRLHFMMLPHQFPSEREKVGFIFSLFKDEALAWGSPLLEQDSPVLGNLNDFLEAMCLVFDDPNRCATAEATLLHLHQGRRSVAEYAAEFRQWVANTTWNQSAQRFHFRKGLSEAIKDELARVDLPADFDAFVRLAIRIDRRLSERRLERQGSFRPSATPTSYSRISTPTPQTPTDSEPEAMQVNLIRGPLSNEEKQWRRTHNLCLYCGSAGHYAINCPSKSKRTIAMAAEGAQIRHQSQIADQLDSVTQPLFSLAHGEEGMLTQHPHFVVPITLQCGDRKISTTAMIDSGAGGNFMDIKFAAGNRIQSIPNSSPVLMETVDGSPLTSGPVTHETVPLKLTLEVNHHEAISFHLISSTQFPVILGVPWLALHNPQIDWKIRTLSFPSEHCLMNCQPSKVTPVATTINEMVATNLTKLPLQYRDFADVCDKKNADQLPPHRPYDCPIELLPGAAIPFGRIYSLSEPELKALREYLQENLAKGFIRPSTSPAGAPIFFVEKKDGSLRPCVDYRDINNITVKNRYPLPLIPELLERLRSAKIFTKLDLRGAYNLVRIRPNDEWKTAFRTRYGHYEYLVMPFGLCNAPATFQHLINDVLRDLLDQFVVAYLDDILIFSDNLENHRKQVRIVLERLRTHHLYIKLEKCEFEQTEIQFLGYVITPKGLTMDASKIKAVLDWPIPKNEKDVQRFVGFANFYRRFIKNFSAVITPITELTRKGTPFQWSDKADTAFSRLKTLFTSAPVLVHPQPELPFIVEVDASDSAVGAILSQRTGPKMLLHPCAFYSRQMVPAERNYDIGNKELLAIKAAFTEWRHLLEGATHPITVLTDHKNLECIRSAKRLSARQARWSLFFSRFNFLVTYRPGSKNGKADALSRIADPLHTTVTKTTILPEDIFIGVTFPSDLMSRIKKGYAEDPVLRDPPRDLHMTMLNGFWIFQQRLFAPESVRLDLLRLYHDSKPAGHPGIRKTQELLARSFWWPKYHEDVKKYVSSCDVCARHKTPRSSPVGLLQPLPIPHRPWGSISMDFIVELPPSKEHTTILVVVDRLTKMGHFIPARGLPSAKQTADLVIREIFRLHGVPDEVVSDRGVQFTSRFWKHFCSNLGINVNLSSAFHPQSNGQTERTNQTLEQYLRCYISYLQDDWLDFLPTAEFAYNNAQHCSTSLSPFFANYGYHPTFLVSLPITTSIPAVTDRLTALRDSQALLKETLLEAQECYKRAADRHRKEAPVYHVGDKVWLSTKNLKLRIPSHKLGQRFMGPFEIIAQINAVTFRLQLPNSMKIHPVFHVALLKPFHENTFPGRALPAPPPVLVDGEDEYEVDKILDSRIFRGKLQYLVCWKGYGEEESSWEPVDNIHAPDLLRSFHVQYPAKPGNRASRGCTYRGGGNVRN